MSALRENRITFRRERTQRQRPPVQARERLQNNDITNKDRVSRALDQLRKGLIPFVERELKGRLGDNWIKEVDSDLRRPLTRHSDGTI